MRLGATEDDAALTFDPGVRTPARLVTGNADDQARGHADEGKEPDERDGLLETSRPYGPPCGNASDGARQTVNIQRCRCCLDGRRTAAIGHPLQRGPWRQAQPHL